MAKKYILLGQLSIAFKLLDFVNNELLPDTGVTKENFWNGLDKCAQELAPKNRKLLEFRENLQKKIDVWHRDKKGEKIDIKEYKNFLVNIGYLKKEGKKFQIETKNVDSEISTIAGPQLVVPVMNARYALNAANARWGSLYNALYGTDVIPESEGTRRGNKYNPKRGKKVIEYARNFLDVNVPLFKGSWKDISEIPKVYNGKLSLKLKDEKQFVGYSGTGNELSSLLLKKNNLHIDIIFDPANKLEVFNPEGNQDKAKVHDIILESAITTIMDHEDSVAAVDAEDKVLGYKNWLGLMKGDLQTELKKGGKKIIRKLNSDRVYTKSEKKGEPDFNEIKLHGRALMLNRNVGHLMTNSSILLKDGFEIPEGILDAFITVTAAIHDFKSKGNSRTNSVYIVKPKMHGPDEAAFTDLIFEKVENVLGLKKYTIKIGIMDEERRTTVNLKECIRAVKNRVVFINTGSVSYTHLTLPTNREV